MVGMASMRQAAEFVQDQFTDRGMLPGLPPICGTWFHVAPETGSDTGRTGKSLSQAFASFSKAVTVLKARATAAGHDGLGDGIVLWSQGTTTAHCTSYLTSAIDFTLSGVTVVGMCAPTLLAQRARIANSAAVAGQSLATLLTISGNNNSFYNLSLFNGGTTGTGCLSITGNRNYLSRVHAVGGAGVSAASVADLDLVLSGSENTLEDCLFGTDTFDKGDLAGGNIKLIGGGARNKFRRCETLTWRSTGTTAGAILLSGGDCITRSVTFEDCLFRVYSLANAVTEARAIIGTVPNNGNLLMLDCKLFGYTSYCVTGNARVYVSSPAANATGGVMTVSTGS